MKILFAAHNGVGGVARHSNELLANLPSALRPPQELIAHRATSGTGIAGRARRATTDSLSLARVARECDVVHLPDYRVPFGVRKPAILTIHDLYFLECPEWYPRLTAAYKRQMLYKSLAADIRAIVCVSQFSRSQLCRLVPEARRRNVHVVIPGVRATSWSEELSSPLPQKYFLTVGTIEPRRNLRTLHSAFSKARQSGLDLEWVIAGNPGYLAKPILRELRADRYVRVMHGVNDARLRSLLLHAEFVVTPSLGEGFGFPPLEAMACGTPAIVSTGSGLDEAVGDSALRVAPLDETGWSTALLRLADDRELRTQLTVSGKTRANAFTWSGAAKAYVRIYESLGLG